MKKLTCIAVVALSLTAQLSYAQSRKRGAGNNITEAEILARDGKYKEASVSIDKVIKSGAIMPPPMLYSYARTYALAGDKSKSVQMLDKAIDKGFWNINRIKEDEALRKTLGDGEVNKAVTKIRTLAAPYLSGKAVLTREEKKSIIELAQSGLKAYYFDTAKGNEMSADIKRMFDGGYFDRIDTLSAFSRELTNYFRNKTNDKHFYIGLNRNAVSERVPNLSVTTPEERNFGFRDVAVRQGNIGYIRWDECIAGPEAYKTALSALNLLRNTRAVIIDISGNGGGNGEISTFLYHYLFKPEDKRFETLLIKKCKGEPEWHRSEPPVAPLEGGPDLGDKPIYVLTSGNTFSAAEYFAFMMKELHRATIIGKNTGGGGNPVNMLSNDRYIMYVPTCQITTTEGKSLEGKGVAPDIEFTTQDWAKEQMEVVNADLKAKGK